MNIIIAHIHICFKIGCTARKMAFFITYQDRQTQGLTCDAITITIIRILKCTISVIILTGKMSYCFCLNYPSEHITTNTIC